MQPQQRAEPKVEPRESQVCFLESKILFSGRCPQESVTSDWEDISDSESTSQHLSNASYSTGSGPRKRPRRTKHATPPPNTPVAKAKRPRPPIVRREEVEDAVVTGARSSVQYCAGMFKFVFRFMQKPIAIFICVWALSLLMSYSFNALRTMLSPLCFIPGMGRSTLCAPPQPIFPLPHHPDFPGLVKAQGSMFEQLVGESVGGSALSSEVLKAEMATRDLSTLVRHSDLKSKDSVADHLFTISVDAKKTARGLTKLNAKVAGAVDEYVAIGMDCLH